MSNGLAHSAYLWDLGVIILEGRPVTETRLIHVATAGNANIAAAFMAMAWTLSRSAQICPIKLHIVDGGLRSLTSSVLERLVSASGGQFEVHWIQLSEQMTLSLPTAPGYPKEAFMRLLLPVLLSSLKKVIWLDCDVLLSTNLEELWSTEMHGYPAAAVQEYGARSVKGMVSEAMLEGACLGNKASLAGFNSGVMLLNLEEWRAQGLGEKVLSLSRHYASSLRFADQDALNVVLAGAWHKLDLEWNVQIGALRSIPRVPAERIAEEVLQRETQLLKYPRIIHFAGSKPWMSGLRSPFRSNYFEALRNSGYYSPMDFKMTYLSATWPAITFFLARRWKKLRGEDDKLLRQE